MVKIGVSTARCERNAARTINPRLVTARRAKITDMDGVLRSVEPEKAFILMFKKLPVLWDPAHVHYTNKRKR